MTLGEKIGELRKEKNLTQEKLSEKLGISRQTLSNWESGNTTPDIVQAKQLAQIFKVSLDDLTNNKIEIECKIKKDVLNNLIGKNCYLEIDSNDFRLNFLTMVKILDIQDNFIKIEFKYKKETIIKLLDRKLIYSFREIIKDGD